jgi:hypothetical protein
MIVYKKKMYIYGGFVGTSVSVAVADYLNDLWSFDLGISFFPPLKIYFTHLPCVCVCVFCVRLCLCFVLCEDICTHTCVHLWGGFLSAVPHLCLLHCLLPFLKLIIINDTVAVAVAAAVSSLLWPIDLVWDIPPRLFLC